LFREKFQPLKTTGEESRRSRETSGRSKPSQQVSEKTHIQSHNHKIIYYYIIIINAPRFAGHGVVHSLLVQNGIIKKWEEEKKISHVLFLQDTNALVVNGFLVALGVAVSEQFMMTSICVPRLAGEAAGAIAKLTDVNGDVDKDIVINVEYNQLDPLLRTDAAGGLGDVADESTGYSPYPGNCNNLVIEFESYCKALRGEDRGVVDEFVNPKYKDEARSVFKKPTRLER